MRSPLPQSISQMSLYTNNNNNTSGYQPSGIIEPLPFHHNNHRPVPIPPASRSLISDYNPSSEFVNFLINLSLILIFLQLMKIWMYHRDHHATSLDM